jgi:hypothetical protein
MKKKFVWVVLPVLVILAACVLMPSTPPVDDLPEVVTVTVQPIDLPTATSVPVDLPTATNEPTVVPSPGSTKIEPVNLAALQAEDFDLSTWPAALVWPEEDRLVAVMNAGGALKLWELRLFPLRLVPEAERLYPAELTGFGPVLGCAADGSSMAVSAGDVLSVRKLDGTVSF